MFTDLEFIKTCLNGLRNRIENLSKDIDKKISYNLEVSKADWNQNDSTAADYVKNRTHYEQEVSVDISGMEYGPFQVGSNQDPTTHHFLCDHNLELQFELGQIWNIIFTSGGSATDYNVYKYGDNPDVEVMLDESGQLYIGTPNASEYHPFYITQNRAVLNYHWIRGYDIRYIKFVCVSGSIHQKELVKLDEKFIPESIVADWNQNDETKLSYIKNRPFYTGDPVENVLVEESTVPFSDIGEGYYQGALESTFEATVGETYKVYWDGTVYECTCRFLKGLPAIGNISILGAGSDTYEPFLIGVSNNEGIQILTVDTSASHTFSISRTVEPVVKIDKKYLVQPDWNQNDETAADYVKNRPFYSETGNVTIENAIGEVLLERFPVFAVGDTVTVNVDGVEHSLVAYEDDGYSVIGDTIISISNGEGQLGWQIFVDGDEVKFHSLEPHTVSYLGIDYHHKIDEKYLPDSVLQFKPSGKSYLTFSSLSSFSLKVYDTTKHWDGTLEYFASDKTWTIWDGTSALSAVADDGEYFLYLRGTGNTVITGNNKNYRWILSGADVKCIGNIENLLDYATVESGRHPTMKNYCYANMFQGCINLTQAPSLPATELANRCYYNMFSDCTSLTKAPSLPATTLANDCYGGMFRNCKNLTHVPSLPSMTLATSCYASMFSGCTSLTQIPSLPATTLETSCYASMFQDCTSLTQAPFLPANTLANGCYSNMFLGCISLTKAPSLPATTLADSCYIRMFLGCINLTQAPSLPATTLADGCYNSMFQGCISLTKAPSLPATTLADGCYSGMFQDCTSLTKVPYLPANTLANGCYSGMFYNCKSLTQAPSLPATTLVTGCYNSMFSGCTSLKLSSTKTSEYTQEYRIPSSGNGTTATNALVHMFISTGGTFTGEPKINTTYYLSTNNMIVRETEIATLNGYVASMINAMV